MAAHRQDPEGRAAAASRRGIQLDQPRRLAHLHADAAAHERTVGTRRDGRFALRFARKSFARLHDPCLGRTDFANNEKLLFVDRQAALDFEAGAEKAAAVATGSADALARLYAGTDAQGSCGRWDDARSAVR